MTAGELIKQLSKFNPDARIGRINEYGVFDELEAGDIYIQEPKPKIEPRTTWRRINEQS